MVAVRRALVSATVTGLVLAVPMPVLAHGLVGRLVSPLPLVVYVTGAALAVALSFAFVLLREQREPEVVSGRPIRAPRWLVLAIKAIGLVGWLWIVAQVIIGGSSDADVSSLFLWVYGWVGLAIVSALVGPVWVWLDPFTTLFDLAAAILRRLGAPPMRPAPYPAGLSTWPAVVGLVGVVWLELVYQGGALGLILIAYTLVTLLLMANFGRDAWRAQGETFSVWFATLNRLAPFGPGADVERGDLVRRQYAAGLFDPGWTTGHVALVAVGTGSILFDGLSQTRPWFDLVGLPSLPAATAQLFLFLGLVIVLALAVARLVGKAAVAAGLVPIAVGYLLAHYLTYLLGDGQRLAIVISDPFQLGWDLFGTAFYEPGTDWIPPVALWTVMLVAVVGGHVVGALAGHAVAVADAPPRVDVRRRQIPLAVLMVGLTVATLWSLGQAVVDESTTSAAVPVIEETTHG